LIERNILACVNHPFIVKMFYSFQNEEKIFFVLEYCPGGEIFNLLLKFNVLNEYQTIFYSA
jgi:protein-serine/threonine kinase